MTTWISSAEAAQILSANSGYTVSPDYVRLLANDGKIGSRVDPKNASRKQFSEEDCQGYTAHRRTARRVEVRVRDMRKGGKVGRPRKHAQIESEKNSLVNEG
jgi:hypothetical protein